jgi:hypothetical protein
MYVEEQRHKAEEEMRLAQEAELKRRRETPETWEHYKAQCDEVNRRARETDVGVQPLRFGHCHNRRQVIFPLSYLQKVAIQCNTCLKALTSDFILFFLL